MATFVATIEPYTMPNTKCDQCNQPGTRIRAKWTPFDEKHFCSLRCLDAYGTEREERERESAYGR